jgi:hypothetical protein
MLSEKIAVHDERRTMQRRPRLAPAQCLGLSMVGNIAGRSCRYLGIVPREQPRCWQQRQREQGNHRQTHQLAVFGGRD